MPRRPRARAKARDWSTWIGGFCSRPNGTGSAFQAGARGLPAPELRQAGPLPSSSTSMIDVVACGLPFNLPDRSSRPYELTLGQLFKLDRPG